MRQFFIILAVTTLSLALSDWAAAANRGAKFPCFWMHGSFADDIGHPSYRIHPETKGGLLAVPDGDRNPENLWRLIPNDQRAVETRVTGDFLICPIEPPQSDRLRLVHIKAARNLHRKIDDWLEHSNKK